MSKYCFQKFPSIPLIYLICTYIYPFTCPRQTTVECSMKNAKRILFCLLQRIKLNTFSSKRQMYLLLLFLINEDGIYWHLSVTLRYKALFASRPSHCLEMSRVKGFNTFFFHFILIEIQISFGKRSFGLSPGENWLSIIRCYLN